MPSTTRFGFRTKRQKTSASTEAKPKSKIRAQPNSKKLNSPSGAEQDMDKNIINTKCIPESASDTDKVSYPSLDGISSDEASGLLYPTLIESTTPTGRKLVYSGTTGKNQKYATPQIESGMITPSLTGVSLIPRDSSFEFQPTPAVQEAGRKILEGLKLSSAAVKVQMNLESPLHPPKTPLKTAKKPRFSDIHQKSFEKLESIASHFSVRKTKPGTTTTISPTKKRKAQDTSIGTLESPFRPQMTSTIDENANEDSPVPAWKRLKAEMKTPGVVKSIKTARFADTPDRPLMACHLHGLSRSVSMKQGLKKSLLPKAIALDTSPITPPKPIAVATPMKASTLLASPVKDRAPTTVVSNSSPVTPTPIKPSASMNKSTVREPSRLPKYVSLSNAAETPAREDHIPSLDSRLGSIEPRRLFGNEAMKRKAEHMEEEKEDLPSHSVTLMKNKRVRLNLPEFSSPAPHTPDRTGSPIKSTIRKRKLDFLATPKMRATPRTITSGTPSRPRWK